MEQRTFDELISDFNSTISKWEIDLKYKFKLLGMIANIGYEHEKMLNNLPSVQPEYEPVTAEDFAKTMSENTTYSFMSWHGEALELMERQGFVICKKTM